MKISMRRSLRQEISNATRAYSITKVSLPLEAANVKNARKT